MSNGDDILPSSFGKSVDLVFAQRLKDAEQLEQIGNVLKKKCVELKAIDHYNLKEAIERKEIVACKWSEDKEYYRAQITKINGDSCVLFVDYGNAEKEAVQNIIKLPDEAKKYPIYGKFLDLEGVSNTEMKDISTKQKENLAALIEADFKVTLRKNEKVVLTSKDGSTLNEKVNKVLVSSNASKSQNEQSKNITFSKNISKVKVASGDQVLALSFEGSADKIQVQRLDDAEKVEEVGVILKDK
jgi:hypothetical protein